MSTQAAADSSTVPAAGASLPARIVGVLFSPRATYADVAARPRWFGALAFVVLLGAIATFVFLSTEVGQNAMLDQQVRQIESFGRRISDAQYVLMEQRAPYGRYFALVFQLVGTPILAVVIAGIALAVFSALLGGDATFKQVFAVLAHSGVVMAVATLFGLPLAYARETLAGATNLGVFAPFLDENSFLARALGAVDLFVVWWAISFAIGLGVLYKRRTGPIATTLIVIYVAIGVIIAAFKTAVS